MLDPLDAGVVTWNGKPVRGEAVPAYRSRVIYVHQKPVLHDGSVDDNLRYPFTLKAHAARAFDREFALDILRVLKRDEAFLEKSARDLSGGEAQIVAFLRAVQLDPIVLLLDECTASLDPPTAQALEAAIDKWLSDRPGERAIVWVSHDRDQTLRMTTRCVSLEAGQVVPDRSHE